MKKILKTILAILAIPILVGIILFADHQMNKDTIYIGYPEDSPVDMVGGGGERIYLKYGQIYALKDDPEKEYKIVAMIIHVTSERYDKMIFFNSPEEAEAAGYKPEKDFAEDYECVKKGEQLFECKGIIWDIPCLTKEQMTNVKSSAENATTTFDKEFSDGLMKKPLCENICPEIKNSQQFPNPEYKAEINWFKRTCKEIGVLLP